MSGRHFIGPMTENQLPLRYVGCFLCRRQKIHWDGGAAPYMQLRRFPSLFVHSECALEVSECINELYGKDNLLYRSIRS